MSDHQDTNFELGATGCVEKTPPLAPRPGDFVNRAKAMLDAHPLFPVPVEEWFDVCDGLLGLLDTAGAERARAVRDLAATRAENAELRDLVARAREHLATVKRRLEAEMGEARPRIIRPPGVQ